MLRRGDCSISPISAWSSRWRIAIGSVSLFADSVDFLEDASINLLILVGLGWTRVAPRAARQGLAGILLVPGLATLWTAWDKLWLPLPPAPDPAHAGGNGRAGGEPHLRADPGALSPPRGSLTRAAFLSARNDAFANIAIIAAGFVTAATLSGWPDLVVGLAIAAINAGAAHEVYTAAQEGASGEAAEPSARPVPTDAPAAAPRSAP